MKNVTTTIRLVTFKSTTQPRCIIVYDIKSFEDFTKCKMKWREMLDEHSCELERWDALEEIFPGDTRVCKIKRYFRRFLTISKTSNLSRRIFKSTAKIHLERLRHLKLYKNIIHPCSSFRQYWELFMVIVYATAAVVIPFYCAFVTTSEDKKKWHFQAVIICDILICLVSFVDMAMNFCTGYVEKDREIVLHQTRIVSRYAGTYFIFDFLSSLPIDHLACLLVMKCIKCHWTPELRYLKFVRIATMKSYLWRSCAECNCSEKLVEILWLLLRIILGLHLFGCLHRTIGVLSLRYTHDKSWSEDPYFLSLDIQYQYIFCCVKATAHFLCLGYGTISPHSIIEQMYTSFLALLGTYFFITCIALVMRWETISNIGTTYYEERMDQIDGYTHYKELSQELHSKIKEFYQFNYQKHLYDESEIMETLSNTLRQQVLRQFYQPFVQNVNFLKNIPPAVLLRIVVALRREVYLVNDVVMGVGQKRSAMYVIASGTVAVYDVSGQEVCHLEDGAHVGEVSLTTQTANGSSVVAVETSVLLRLERTDLWRALAPFPDLQQRVQVMVRQSARRREPGGAASVASEVQTSQRSASGGRRASPANASGAVNEGASTSAQALARDRASELNFTDRSMTL